MDGVISCGSLLNLDDISLPSRTWRVGCKWSRLERTHGIIRPRCGFKSPNGKPQERSFVDQPTDLHPLDLHFILQAASRTRSTSDQ